MPPKEFVAKAAAAAALERKQKLKMFFFPLAFFSLFQTPLNDTSKTTTNPPPDRGHQERQRRLLPAPGLDEGLALRV